MNSQIYFWPTNSGKSSSLLKRIIFFLYFFPDIRTMKDRNAQQEELVKLAYAKMPFGKYKDRYLSDLPEHYLLWFRQQGFPNGKLGQNLELILELKINGMEHILRNIRHKYAK